MQILPTSSCLILCKAWHGPNAGLCEQHIFCVGGWHWCENQLNHKRLFKCGWPVECHRLKRTTPWHLQRWPPTYIRQVPSLIWGINKSVAFSDSGNLTAADPSLKPTYMCENTVQSLTPSKSLSLSPIAVTNSYGKTFSNHWNTHKYGKHWPLNWKQNTNWNVTWLNLLYFVCPQKRLFFPEETTVLLLTSVP